MELEYSNVLLCHVIGEIGGIETFFYEIAKKYGHLDITIAYQYGNQKQIRRLSKYVRCIRLTKKIKCKKCFLMYAMPLDLIDADEYIQFIHANFKVQSFPINTDSRISKYYGVSDWVAKDYEDLLKANGVIKEVKTCYNPITIEKPRKVLKLISATRLSKEKGKDRMIILANELTKANIPFIWLVFTNDVDKIDNPNIIYMKTTLEVRDYIALADYYVVLSDTEGCPYSPMEANCLGVPCLYTPVPSMIEIGIQGYMLPFDMKDIPLEDIYNKIPKVNYTPPKDIWDELLVHDKRTYDPKDIVEVQSLKTYEDNGEWTISEQVKIVNREEANRLVKEGKVKITKENVFKE